MGETNHKELMEAIEVFKDTYGIKEPLDMLRLDSIIMDLRIEKAKKKRKKENK